MIPTAVCDTALFVTWVRVFLTKPIGFLKVRFVACLPSSEILKESMALALKLSIGPLLFALKGQIKEGEKPKDGTYLSTFIEGCFGGNMWFDMPLRSLEFFKKLIWF